MVIHPCYTRGSKKADRRTDNTTLSPFLSVKSLASHLDCKGPSFTLDVIQSISYILHRICPSQEDIFQGCKAVQNTEDDFWPSNGEGNSEEDGVAWDSTSDTKVHTIHQPGFKRRRVGQGERPDIPLPHQCSTSLSRVTGYSVTMQSATTFSVSSTSIHSGFTSAGAHLQDLVQRKSGNVTEIDQDVLSQNEVAAQSSNGNKKIAASIKHGRNEDPPRLRNGQGTLLTFFGPATKGGDASKEDPIRETSPPLTLESPQAETLPDSRDAACPISQSRQPMLPIPQSLAEHRLKSAPIATRPSKIPQGPDHKSKQYPFFSSSPPPIESLMEEAEASGEKVLYVDKSHDRNRPHAVSQIPESRPAMTFHVTTTTQVRSAQAATRTLGVRRSMHGWTNRGGHTFCVPGRKSTR